MKQSEARNFKLTGTYENLCLRILLLGMYPKDIQTCVWSVSDITALLVIGIRNKNI